MTAANPSVRDLEPSPSVSTANDAAPDRWFGLWVVALLLALLLPRIYLISQARNALIDSDEAITQNERNARFEEEVGARKPEAAAAADEDEKAA